MQIWQWIALIFLYALFSAALSEGLGVPIEYVFYGLPALFVATIAFIAIKAVISRSSKQKASSTRSDPPEVRPQGVQKNEDADFTKESLRLLNSLAEKKEIPEIIEDLAAFAERDKYHSGRQWDQKWNMHLAYLGLACRSDAKRARECFSELFVRAGFAINDLQTAKKEQDDFHEAMDAPLSKFIDEVLPVLDDDDLTQFAKKYIAPLLRLEPEPFPTPFHILNVSAIPEGSFLEPTDFSHFPLPVNFSTNELREYSLNLIDACGHENVREYIHQSLTMARDKTRKTVEKLLSKEKLSTQGVQNALLHAKLFCYSEDPKDILFAESIAEQAIEKSRLSKQTKGLVEASTRLREFLDQPKSHIFEREVKSREADLVEELASIEGILSVEQSWDSPDIYERGLNLSNQMLGGKIGSDHKENLLNVLIALRKNVALLGEESKVQRVSSELVQHIKRIRELGS